MCKIFSYLLIFIYYFSHGVLFDANLVFLMIRRHTQKGIFHNIGIHISPSIRKSEAETSKKANNLRILI